MKNKLKIIQADITELEVDAIVNAANNTLLGGGGVDGAIHRAGGPIILEQCKKIGGCPTGEARITSAGNLPSKYVIHTVGPIYKDGKSNEDYLLSSAYKSSLELAQEYKIKTIAFPFISTGAYSYPKEEAARIAIETILNSEEIKSLDQVYLVLFSDKDYKLVKKTYETIDIE